MAAYPGAGKLTQKKQSKSHKVLIVMYVMIVEEHE